MTCQSFASTSASSLWYIEDTFAVGDPLNLETIAWKQVPFTSESFDLNLTTTVSDEIRPDRSYRDSVITQGEVPGGFSADFQRDNFNPFIIGALMSSKDPLAWDDSLPGTTDIITNELTVSCFAFMKKITVPGGKESYFVFRGCQIGDLTLNFDSGSLSSLDITTMGTGGEAYDDTVAAPAGWTYVAAADVPLMNSVTNLSNMDLSVSGGASIPTTFQSLSITFSNTLRSQYAVGKGTPYPVGVGVSRFMASASATLYFAEKTIYDNFLANTDLALTFDAEDSDSQGYSFVMDKVKVESGSVPQISGPDADLTISTEFRAYQDSTTGTVQITIDTTT